MLKPLLKSPKVFRNPVWADKRNIVLLEYDCTVCKSKCNEILLSSLYQENLVISSCSTCSTRYCLGDQLDWFRDVCEKNPQLILELVKRGELIEGVINTDFETTLMEQKQLHRIMKRDDATDMIGIEYHESEITKYIKVNLLKIKEGAAPDEPF